MKDLETVCKLFLMLLVALFDVGMFLFLILSLLKMIF